MVSKGVIAVIALVVVCVYCAEDDIYSSKYENIDIDSILKSDRLLRNYVDCLVGKGKCTPEGDDLKKVIPDALENECSKCNEKQKEGTRKVIKHLVENKKDWWSEVVAKYDPEGKFKSKYEELSKKEGIAI